MSGTCSKPRGTWTDPEDDESSLLSISCPSPKTAWTLGAKVSKARGYPPDRVKQEGLLLLGRFSEFRMTFSSLYLYFCEAKGLF